MLTKVTVVKIVH